jgi:hypothetical protein
MISSVSPRVRKSTRALSLSPPLERKKVLKGMKKF